MSDDLSPLESRISSIVDDEERLNRDRKSALGTKNARRDAEKRTEAAHMATLERGRDHQARTNAEKERKFQADIKREGEIVDLSKEIRDDYIRETRHRQAAKESMQAKISALESKLRSIEGRRP